MNGADASLPDDAEWWRNWRDADFSWSALATQAWLGWIVDDQDCVVRADTHQIYGGTGLSQRAAVREASLQDYWRADPATGRLRDPTELLSRGEIVARENESESPTLGAPETYHVCHLPLTYSDGLPSGKAHWPRAALYDIMTVRLAAASEATWTGDNRFDRELTSADTRAQFQGCVWPEFVLKEHAIVSGRFERSHFGGKATFHNARFTGDVRFDDCRFGSTASFASSRFEGYVQFDHSSFGRRSFFSQCVFSAPADFRVVTFCGDSRFDDTHFLDDLLLNNSRFLDAAFFNNVRFEKLANMLGVIFRGFASFGQSQFNGMAMFLNAEFLEDARFDGAIFSDHCDFGYSRLHVAIFDGVTFQGPMRFRDAIFDRLAAFRGIVWPATPERWQQAFSETRFLGVADFSGCGLKAFSAFDGAILERGIGFDETTEVAGERQFRRELRQARDETSPEAIAEWTTRMNEHRRWRVESEFRMERRRLSDEGSNGEDFQQQLNKRLESVESVSDAEQREYAASARDTRLRSLEGGCRVLRRAMREAANKSREQLLHRFELETRRARSDASSVERILSRFYELTSNYGASIARPLGIILLALLPGFALMYWVWAGALEGTLVKDIVALTQQPLSPDSWASAWHALSFSASRMFPFGFWAPTSAEGSWLTTFLDHGWGWGFGLRAVATLQSALAIVLLFLSILALRRRFQID